MTFLMQLRHDAFIKAIAILRQTILQFAKLYHIAIIVIVTIIEYIVCMEVEMKLSDWNLSKLLKKKTSYSLLSYTPFVITAWHINMLAFVIDNAPTDIKE